MQPQIWICGTKVEFNTDGHAKEIYVLGWVGLGWGDLYLFMGVV